MYKRQTEEKAFETTTVNSDLQISATDNQTIKQSNGNLSTYDTSEQKSTFSIVKKYLWLGISGVLAVIVGLLGFKDELFSKKFYYSFIDADRNSKINAELQVQILKENESPTVSYTHLDVYKRQSRWKRAENQTIGSFNKEKSS